MSSIFTLMFLTCFMHPRIISNLHGINSRPLKLLPNCRIWWCWDTRQRWISWAVTIRKVKFANLLVPNDLSYKYEWHLKLCGLETEIIPWQPSTIFLVYFLYLSYIRLQALVLSNHLLHVQVVVMGIVQVISMRHFILTLVLAERI